jgi:hypothetical protein
MIHTEMIEERICHYSDKGKKIRQIETKVSHNDKHWVSDYDNNVWEPGVFGWTEATI